MGNSLGCSASGERLVSAARDGDLLEARMLLDFNPCLAKYSTFGGLNSPLHFAAAKGHSEIVMLLLDHGADVNSKNYCGQTALMQACRCGHWEVVQALMLFRCNVFGADYLNGRTALHFAAAGGHARCLRLVVADFVPSISFDPVSFTGDFTSEDGVGSHLGPKYNKHSLAKFLNKQADGGITALHMAALNGYFDCVQLLLDLNADVSAVTFHYGSAMNLIGGGSSPLHYAACGGNLKCCQLLLVKGASRLALNCNGWLPVDVARIWGRHWLEPLLSPQSEQPLPVFSTSNYLSLPLLSILNIARDYGLTVSSAPHDDINVCAVCLERACAVASAGCSHELCINCALYLCSSSTSSVSSEIVVTPGSVPCPLCRHGIVEFVKLPSMPAGDFKLNHTLSLCNPCIINISDLDPPETCSSSTNTSTTYRRGSTVSSRVNCTVSCTPFPSVMIPLCSRDADPCPFELEGEQQGLSLGPSQPQSAANKMNKSDPGMGKTTCSRMFWNRRSCQREQQCNSEINI